MGMPVAWHRRQALMLASQLPESTEDARMILRALEELLETFLSGGTAEAHLPPSNVLPFSH